MARNFLITRTTENGKYLDMSLIFLAIAKDKFSKSSPSANDRCEQIAYQHQT